MAVDVVVLEDAIITGSSQKRPVNCGPHKHIIPEMTSSTQMPAFWQRHTTNVEEVAVESGSVDEAVVVVDVVDVRRY